MTEFTPMLSTLGGVMIGLAVAALYFFNGKFLGVSGITAAVMGTDHAGRRWRLIFIAGLLAGGALLLAFHPAALSTPSPYSIPVLIAAGLLVGYGSSMGKGCTSGHGICGISRFSARSLVATGVFIVAGFTTVYVTRHLLGGVLS